MTALDLEPPLAGEMQPRPSRLPWYALGAWATLVVTSHVWGRVLRGSTAIGLQVPPLHSSWRVRFGPATILVALLAVVLVVSLPRWFRSLPWPAVPWVSGAVTAIWALTVAANDGITGWTRGVITSDYLATARQVESPSRFLGAFTETLRDRDFGVHTSGHPPGFVLVLWCLDRVGLRADFWPTALCVGGGALAVVFVVMSVGRVCGEASARAAAPFLVVSPAAIWIATTPDAFFAGVGAAAVCATICATVHPRRRRADALAALGGALFAATAMLSYGLVLLGLIPVAVAVYRRRWRPLLLATVVAVALLTAFGAITGFWWTDGLAATKDRYWAGIASTRPLRYFLIANVAALGLAAGPATAVAVCRQRVGGVRVIVSGALAAVIMANLSAMSKGEVERIWLPFTVWILAANAALGVRLKTARRFLALQAAVAIALQTLVHNA